MKNVLKTAPVAYPLGLKEVKQHLNISVGWTEDDDYLDTLIAMATDKVEQFLHRRLITQTWYSYFNKWPNGDSIELPFGKLQTGTAPIVTYTDTAGDDTIWSTDEYNVDNDSEPGRIVLEYGYSWPTAALHPQNPIVVEFVCGYGVAGSNVDPMIKHAIKLAIADSYEVRETEIVGVGTIILKLKTIENLLIPKTLY